jgi:poly(3-hydroxyalkanoate) depolymerase
MSGSTAHGSPSAISISFHDIAGQRLRVGVRRGDDSTTTPLLLFNGIGANIELFGPFLDALLGPEAIVFDVPGVGGSPTPALPYRLRHLARLARRLLDTLGRSQVDVLGISWGGALAQQFAFQYPHRCRRLILAATSTGHLMIPAAPSVLVKMATPRRYRERGYMDAHAGDIYGGAFRDSPELASELLRHVRWSSDYGYYLQLLATFGWTSLPWLPLLRQPTLVMAGLDDPLVPKANGHILARLIPRSKLVFVDDGHLFLITRAQESARLAQAFLRGGPASTATPNDVRRRAA